MVYNYWITLWYSACGRLMVWVSFRSLLSYVWHLGGGSWGWAVPSWSFLPPPVSRPCHTVSPKRHDLYRAARALRSSVLRDSKWNCLSLQSGAQNWHSVTSGIPCWSGRSQSPQNQQDTDPTSCAKSGKWFTIVLVFYERIWMPHVWRDLCEEEQCRSPDKQLSARYLLEYWLLLDSARSNLHAWPHTSIIWTEKELESCFYLILWNASVYFIFCHPFIISW